MYARSHTLALYLKTLTSTTFVTSQLHLNIYEVKLFIDETI